MIAGILAKWADERRPGTSHLPASNEDLRLWSPYFQNGDFLDGYVTHLKSAHTLSGMKADFDEELILRLLADAERLNVHLIKAALSIVTLECLCSDVGCPG